MLRVCSRFQFVHVESCAAAVARGVRRGSAVAGVFRTTLHGRIRAALGTVSPYSGHGVPTCAGPRVSSAAMRPLPEFASYQRRRTQGAAATCQLLATVQVTLAQTLALLTPPGEIRTSLNPLLGWPLEALCLLPC